MAEGGKYMIRLIAFDMDGTLLDQHKKVLPETKELLERASSRGIVIVPATGRPFCGISEEIYHLQGVQYVLTCNGAGIYERDSGACLYEEGIDLQRILPLIERLDALEVMADPFLKGKAFMNEKKISLVEQMQISEELKAYIYTSRIMVPDLPEYLRQRGDDIEKLTINFVEQKDGTRRDYDKALAILKDFPDLNAVSGGMHNIEVTKKGISKASGLRWLGDYLGISMEEMIAFGDSGNDLAMLEAAGVGVAMGNAEKDVLSVADFVTKSNEEEGIAYALHTYIPDL